MNDEGEGASHPIWDYDELDAFLKAPQKHLPGTKMTFIGLKKQEERVAMMAYLQSLGSTLAIPAPRPAEAAPAPDGAAAEGDPTATGSTAVAEPAPGTTTTPPAGAAPAPAAK